MLIASASPPRCSPPPPSPARRDDLNAFTKSLKGLDGQFTQQVFDANGKLKEASSGRVALSAPRLFRWEYVKPFAQLIVADGKTVWVYDPDLEQVTRRTQGVEEQNSPLSALIDPTRARPAFMVKECRRADGLDWLSCARAAPTTPASNPRAWASTTPAWSACSIVDALGQRTEIELLGLEAQPGFAANTFTLHAAQGRGRRRRGGCMR